ncbi:hypothetical protein PUNSTDRAFT_83132 [Punctularia strigosozonata HHB-11173 SS5]|uniref:uncharacterized protein n=1 Tax=Punctularia strigosozonata (strain HHB-11173) TaxID=741275 RepID=UPI0004418311|nr:uncharacterized protein PUNSTDRAFT_83132 [Punctularia strigosozonata HHB-11173 SS5]EIN11508.1 hypothetical protein PUNSTDRAFT_83132 [Punctularia strigosozonata HHB-11173 SS5]
MAVAIALWSIVLKPGQKEVVQPAGDLRITNVALGDQLDDENARTSVKFTFSKPVQVDEDEEEEEEEETSLTSTILASLTPGKIEQANLNLVLEEDGDYLFEAVGKNTIYLTGNYIDQIPPDQPPYGEDDSELDDEEDDYDLREVSSDVEMDPEDIIEEDGRFEELEDSPEPEPESKKRQRADEADTAAEGTLSKAQKKKLKKLKTANGEAVPTGDEKPAPKEEKKEETTKQEGEKKEKGDKKKGKKPNLGEMKELDGGLKYQDAVVGTGKVAKPGSRVSMRYIGKLDNGKVFDSNTKGKPFDFNLGAGEVIKGWDLGIAGMQVGGQRLLVIPPKLAYGKKKMGNDIPPNSTLTFEVKLLNVK